MDNPADRFEKKAPLIGEILVKRNLITRKQLEEALEIQKKEQGFVGEILVKLGYLEEKDIVVALIVQCGLPYIAITKYEIPTDVLMLLPVEMVKKHQIVPLDRVGNILSVVMANPLIDAAQEELERTTNCRIATFISTKSEIQEAIKKWYPDYT